MVANRVIGRTNLSRKAGSRRKIEKFASICVCIEIERYDKFRKQKKQEIQALIHGERVNQN